MRDSEDEVEVNTLIEKYFSLGFQQKEIVAFLKHIHNISMPLRTLKRKLSNLRLFRRKNFSPIEDVVRFLEKEIKKCGQLHGYKWMHLRCIQNNLTVTQEVVRELLQVLDPEGVNSRSRKRLRRRQYYSKGPNFLWHLDSYDKLKPYGLCINGCIDGFSRHIIWLKVGPTSSDPKVIAGYFVDAIKLVGGCPKTIRSDMGTENKIVEQMQCTFSELFTTEAASTSRPPFLYGRSTHNQRIESWWCILRKHHAQFWMNMFQRLKDDGLFDGSVLDKSLVQFCFGSLVQNEMDQVVREWNAHKISKSRNSIMPSGRPCIMFEMPSLYNAKNCLTPVPQFALEPLLSNCKFIHYPCDKDFYDLCKILIYELRLRPGDEDPEHAVDLYIHLRAHLKTIFI